MNPRGTNAGADEIAAIADGKELSRYRAAESMSFGDRLLAGPALFDMCVMMMKAGIRLDHPEADEATVAKLVRTRLAAGRRHEAEL